MFGASSWFGFRLKRATIGPEATLLFGSPGVFAFNGLVYLDLAGSGARWVPYAVVGAGFYSWRGEHWPTSDYWLHTVVGAGLRFADRGNWEVEVRWHPFKGDVGDVGKPSLLTFGFGRRFSWR